MTSSRPVVNVTSIRKTVSRLEHIVDAALGWPFDPETIKRLEALKLAMTDPKEPEPREVDDAPDDDQPEPLNDTPEEPTEDDPSQPQEDPQ